MVSTPEINQRNKRASHFFFIGIRQGCVVCEIERIPTHQRTHRLNAVCKSSKGVKLQNVCDLKSTPISDVQGVHILAINIFIVQDCYVLVLG